MSFEASYSPFYLGKNKNSRVDIGIVYGTLIGEFAEPNENFDGIIGVTLSLKKINQNRLTNFGLIFGKYSDGLQIPDNQFYVAGIKLGVGLRQ